MITVELPRALRPHARGSTSVVLEDDCATVGEALAALAEQWPGVTDRVLDERGDLRPHVNVFVESESVKFLGGLAAPVAKGSTITILPAVSGG
jgi:molybdopterin converting factor small subunit